MLSSALEKRDYLASPPLSLQEYLARLTPLERRLYDEHVRITAEDQQDCLHAPQYTDKWYRYRGSVVPRVTGSVAPAAVYHNKYSTFNVKAKEMFDDRKNSVQNEATEYGHEKEPIARTEFQNQLQAFLAERAFALYEEAKSRPDFFEQELAMPSIPDVPHSPPQVIKRSGSEELLIPTVSVREQGLLLSLEYPFLGVSADGIVSVNGIDVAGLEIKCPFHHSPLYGTIPTYYQDQILMSMAVTGLPHWFFMAWKPTVSFWTRLDHRPKYCQNVLLPRLCKFFFELILPFAAERFRQQSTLESSAAEDTEMQPAEGTVSEPVCKKSRRSAASFCGV
jgi:hypothetical protein